MKFRIRTECASQLLVMHNRQPQLCYSIALIVTVCLSCLLLHSHTTTSKTICEEVILSSAPLLRAGPDDSSLKPTVPRDTRRTVSEKLLGQIDSSTLAYSYAVSPNLRRIASVIRAASKQFVVVDGKEQKSYDGIGKEYSYIDSQGSHTDYLGAPLFSPNSQRVAYLAREGKRWFVVVDGKEEQPYDDIGGLTLLFSPNSKRLAYVVGLGKKQSVVVDGKEHKSYDWIGDLTFSPDSNHLAYWAGEGGRRLVVVDDKEGKAFDGISSGEGPLFLTWDSPWVLDAGFGIAFSPNSRRMAYGAPLGARIYAVVNGKEKNSFRGGIHEAPVFSPDSRHLAYVGSGEKGSTVVIDGKEEKPYDEVEEGSLQFSPDSRRLGYAAKAGGKWFVVVDSSEEKPHDRINEGPLFSPNSRRVAYVAHEGERWYVVVDGKEDKPYDEIMENRLFMPGLVFSPDSRYVAYWAKVGGKWLVVADGSEGKPYDDFAAQTILFDSANSLRYVAVEQTAKGEDVYVVEETID